MIEPERQHGKSKIDVYFEAKVDGALVGFAIEDKINSEMHDDQLPRQKDAIGSDKRLDCKRLIYYKTGYVFEDEREKAKDAGFVVFDTQDMLDFLNGGPDQEDQEILRQYREHLANQVKERNELLQNLDMTRAFVQSEFMRMLRNRLVENMDCWAGFLNETMRDPDTQDRVKRGKNRGASGPWTQYWFSKHLFWRLDDGHKDYKLLRLRVWSQEAENVLGDCWGTDVWRRWIKTFSLLQKEIQLPEVNFNRRMRQGDGLVNEGTVGAIDIKNAFDGDFEKTLDKIVELHCAFLQRIS